MKAKKKQHPFQKQENKPQTNRTDVPNDSTKNATQLVCSGDSTKTAASPKFSLLPVSPSALRRSPRISKTIGALATADEEKADNELNNPPNPVKSSEISSLPQEEPVTENALDEAINQEDQIETSINASIPQVKSTTEKSQDESNNLSNQIASEPFESNISQENSITEIEQDELNNLGNKIETSEDSSVPQDKAITDQAHPSSLVVDNIEKVLSSPCPGVSGDDDAELPIEEASQKADTTEDEAEAEARLERKRDAERRNAETHRALTGGMSKEEWKQWQWTEATRRNEARARHQLVTGENNRPRPAPKEKVDTEKLTDREKFLHKIQERNEKIDALIFYYDIEEKFVTAYMEIKMSLTKINPQIEKTIRILKAVMHLPVPPYMVLKNTEMINVLLKLRRYRRDARIRHMASEVYNKFRCLFLVPERETFVQFFRRQASELEEKIKKERIKKRSKKKRKKRPKPAIEQETTANANEPIPSVDKTNEDNVSKGIAAPSHENTNKDDDGKASAETVELQNLETNERKSAEADSDKIDINCKEGDQARSNVKVQELVESNNQNVLQTLESQKDICENQVSAGKVMEEAGGCDKVETVQKERTENIEEKVEKENGQEEESDEETDDDGEENSSSLIGSTDLDISSILDDEEDEEPFWEKEDEHIPNFDENQLLNRSLSEGVAREFLFPALPGFSFQQPPNQVFSKSAKKRSARTSFDRSSSFDESLETSASMSFVSDVSSIKEEPGVKKAAKKQQATVSRPPPKEGTRKSSRSAAKDAVAKIKSYVDLDMEIISEKEWDFVDVDAVDIQNEEEKGTDLNEEQDQARQNVDDGGQSLTEDEQDTETEKELQELTKCIKEIERILEEDEDAEKEIKTHAGDQKCHDNSDNDAVETITEEKKENTKRINVLKVKIKSPIIARKRGRKLKETESTTKGLPTKEADESVIRDVPLQIPNNNLPEILTSVSERIEPCVSGTSVTNENTEPNEAQTVRENIPEDSFEHSSKELAKVASPKASEENCIIIEKNDKIVSEDKSVSPHGTLTEPVKLQHSISPSCSKKESLPSLISKAKQSVDKARNTSKLENIRCPLTSPPRQQRTHTSSCSMSIKKESVISPKGFESPKFATKLPRLDAKSPPKLLVSDLNLTPAQLIQMAIQKKKEQRQEEMNKLGSQENPLRNENPLKTEVNVQVKKSRKRISKRKSQDVELGMKKEAIEESTTTKDNTKQEKDRKSPKLTSSDEVPESISTLSIPNASMEEVTEKEVLDVKEKSKKSKKRGSKQSKKNSSKSEAMENISVVDTIPKEDFTEKNIGKRRQRKKKIDENVVRKELVVVEEDHSSANLIGTSELAKPVEDDNSVKLSATSEPAKKRRRGSVRDRKKNGGGQNIVIKEEEIEESTSTKDNTKQEKGRKSPKLTSSDKVPETTSTLSIANASMEEVTAQEVLDVMEKSKGKDRGSKQSKKNSSNSEAVENISVVDTIPKEDFTEKNIGKRGQRKKKIDENPVGKELVVVEEDQSNAHLIGTSEPAKTVKDDNSIDLSATSEPAKKRRRGSVRDRKKNGGGHNIVIKEDILNECALPEVRKRSCKPKGHGRSRKRVEMLQTSTESAVKDGDDHILVTNIARRCDQNLEKVAEKEHMENSENVRKPPKRSSRGRKAIEDIVMGNIMEKRTIEKEMNPSCSAQLLEERAAIFSNEGKQNGRRPRKSVKQVGSIIEIKQEPVDSVETYGIEEFSSPRRSSRIHDVRSLVNVKRGKRKVLQPSKLKNTVIMPPDSPSSSERIMNPNHIRSPLTRSMNKITSICTSGKRKRSPIEKQIKLENPVIMYQASPSTECIMNQNSVRSSMTKSVDKITRICKRAKRKCSAPKKEIQHENPAIMSLASPSKERIMNQSSVRSPVTRSMDKSICKRGSKEVAAQSKEIKQEQLWDGEESEGIESHAGKSATKVSKQTKLSQTSAVSHLRKSPRSRKPLSKF